MNVLIDSDVIIEVLRGRDAALVAQWSILADSEAAILVSPIAIAEIGAGAFASEMAAIRGFFTPLTCVAMDEQVGLLAGQYLREYSKSHGLKIADALVAASAMRCHAALWTRNPKHYPMPDLTMYA